MQKSKKARWFKASSHRAMSSWFASFGITLEPTETRTEFYLPLNKDNTTLKLHEGSIEIKYRIGDATKGIITDKTERYFESRTIWSFNADKADKLRQTMVSKNDHYWIETVKSLIRAIAAEDSNVDL